MNQTPVDIARVVAECENPDRLSDSIKVLYAELDEVIAGHKPTCWNHGDCCKFGSYGHRLYVTSVELAYFRQGHAADWRSAADSDVCPYQVDGRCTAREHRPMGCRVFFCDPDAQHWQGQVYEEFLARLKRLGEQSGVEYRYLEWLSALQAWPGTQKDTALAHSVDPVRPGMIELNVLN
jgi:hypothetical protein